MSITYDSGRGPQARPQQYFSAPPSTYHAPTAGRGVGYPPAPQVDSYPPQPQYRPAAAAWSQPGYGYPMPPVAAPPSWHQPRPPANRNTVVAIVATVALLLAGGTVAMILALSGDKAVSSGPAAPQVPGNQVPQRPVAYPQLPAPPADGPVAPIEPRATDRAASPTAPPEQPTVEPSTVEPSNIGAAPGSAAAEQVAGSFVAAMRVGKFSAAETYLCSARADGFATIAAKAATQIDLDSMTLVGVTVSDDHGQLVMQYSMAGQTRKLHETLPMVIEQGSWKVCN